MEAERGEGHGCSGEAWLIHGCAGNWAVVINDGEAPEQAQHYAASALRNLATGVSGCVAVWVFVNTRVCVLV
jgi:hypothetical protein